MSRIRLNWAASIAENDATLQALERVASEQWLLARSNQVAWFSCFDRFTRRKRGSLADRIDRDPWNNDLRSNRC